MALIQSGAQRSGPRQAWHLAGLAILGLCLFLILATCINIAAYEFAPDVDGLTEAERATAVIATRSSLLQLLVGLSLLGGLLFTARTYALSRAVHRTDSFAKAIEHLGNPSSAAVRAGGAYSLGQLAHSSPTNWPMVEDLLASFVRERAVHLDTLGSDVQAALTVLGRRPKSTVGHGSKPLDLRGVLIPTVELSALNFERARLDGAHLSNANLVETDLYRASLKGAHLDGAKLIGSTLVETSLVNASLKNADLFEAKTRRSDVTGADLDGVKNLTDAQRAGFIGLPVNV